MSDLPWSYELRISLSAGHTLVIRRDDIGTLTELARRFLETGVAKVATIDYAARNPLNPAQVEYADIIMAAMQWREEHPSGETDPEVPRPS